MVSSNWRSLVSRYIKEEMGEDGGWKEAWPGRMGFAFERACMVLESEDVHPDDRQNALAYLAAWCFIGAAAEEERRSKEFCRKSMFYGMEAKKKRQGK